MNEELKNLIKKNLKINQEMHEMLKSIKRFILIQRIFSFLKLLILVIPLALGIIYLPSLWDKYIPKLNQGAEQYRSLLNLGEGASDINRTEISPEQLKNLSPSQIEKIKQILESN